MLLFDKDEYIKMRVKELKGEFEGLTEDQKKLKVYRMIIEMQENGFNMKESIEKAKRDVNSFEYYVEMSKIYDILALIKAADFEAGILSPILLSMRGDNNKPYRDVYKKSLISYQNILNKYKELAEYLNIESSLELSHFFSYLLWNGYFSVTKTHSYKLQDRLLLPSMHSFDVINGQGVCLAYSELLNNFLKTCGKKSALLECYVPTKKDVIKPIYRPKIKRKIDSNKRSKLLMKSIGLLLCGMIKKTGNHAVTLIEENDKTFIYDPTNLYVLNIKDSKTASLINGEGEFEIKPISSLLIDPTVDPNKIFETLFNEKIKPAYTQNDIYKSFEKIVKIAKENSELLDDVYREIHSDLEKIHEETKINGGCFKVLKKIKEQEKKRKEDIKKEK